MFKIESYFGPLLMSYLNKYVKLEEESFKLSLWGGDVTFHNLELQYDILEDLMPLPIGFKSGQVHELKVHVPWTKLGSESVVITLNTVECILALKTDFLKTSKREPSLKESLSPGTKQKSDRNIPPSYLKSYLVNIINNIHVKVNNLIIKFVEDDMVLSMNAKSLEYLPVTSSWSRGFIDFSSSNFFVHKLVEVSDLTICLDQMDANGHIELYQEPILYRCCVECRFVLRYQTFNSNKPDFLKLNMKFTNLELNVTTSQMQMMRRLVELFYALYYNNINWDAVVGCGFSNQITKTADRIKEPVQGETMLDDNAIDNSEQSSWGSWAWSYVPSLFSLEEGLIDDNYLETDQKVNINDKKTLIFGIYFDSMKINLKKSQVIKSSYGAQRSGRSPKTALFLILKGNNIGINIASRGLGFFNVQLGCADIDLVNSDCICPCGQFYKIEDKDKSSEILKGSLIHMGSEIPDKSPVHDFYLTGSLFSTDNDDVNVVMTNLGKLNNISSQESYEAFYSQEQCLNNFGALWFDYVYCMQIVKDSLDESQVDPNNLCNTDGIRESSVMNLYLGPTVSNINSHSVHTLVEITNALDTSKYSTYFKTLTNDDRRSNTFYPTEDQVARIHEFIPLRQFNMTLTQSTVKIHTFIESHNVFGEFPIIELKAASIRMSKSIPMYPRHLIDCVGVLNTNLLKESNDLLNKCYVSKMFAITGVSISLLIPDIHKNESDAERFIRWEIAPPCDISFSNKSLMFANSWKTASFTNDETILKISNVRLKLVPSHAKLMLVIASSNYSWIGHYLGFVTSGQNLIVMNRQLDALTVKLTDCRSSLTESCFQCNYEDKTYELHVSLPDIVVTYWKTSTSYFIDAKVSQDELSVYLKEPSSSKIIPVLDNKLDQNTSLIPPQIFPFCSLYCQIPTQTKPANYAFSFNCQIGSINCMFSHQLVSWIMFPVLDFELDDYSRTQDVITPTKSREGTILSDKNIISDTRSTADGTSRPQSPTILFNTFPIPGRPRSIITLETSLHNEKNQFLSTRSGWWNMFKEGCSKYFFFLQSLDVCIKVNKSKFYVVTVTDSLAFQSNVNSCSQWMERFADNCQNSIFLITITRLALINSQRKEFLEGNFEKNSDSGIFFQQSKSASFIESLPWELIFHDIQVDCVHSLTPIMNVHSIFYDSILKPVSINCTLSATPKCSSPERLDSLYSISWGVHVDITEVQPTLKQIYLTKLVDFFVGIFLKVSSYEFTKKNYQLLTGHYYIVKNSNTKVSSTDQTPTCRSKQSISTKSTKKSTSHGSITEHKYLSSNYRIARSKLETQTVKETDVRFKLSFWVQCTLSQFQLIILLDNDNVVDFKRKNVCLIMQVDDVTGSIDVQEKFVEIKSKFGSMLCQLGEMKDGRMIHEISILKSGSKFLSEKSFQTKGKEEFVDDLQLGSVTRHCLSAAIIRTTVNNLSQRPLSTYHQFKDTDSFKSYPTEFTGNFSSPADTIGAGKTFVTQISSIIEPFELVISSYFIEQCHKLIDTLMSIYLRCFHSTCDLSDKINASSIKLEPYFISEDMPKLHMLIKSCRIIMPCFTNRCDKMSNMDCENECIILNWTKISLQPFGDNPISRPPLKDDSRDERDYFTKCESVIDSAELETKPTNSLDDNRQFQLNIFNCGIYSSKYNDHFNEKSESNLDYDISLSKTKRYADNFGTSIMHGQNPAFEWNNFSKMSSHFHSRNCADDQLKPILKPVDIQIIFAGALYQNSDGPTNSQILGGYGLEVNILTSVELFIDMITIEACTVVATNLNRLFSYGNAQPVNPPSGSDETYSIDSIDMWITQKKLDYIIPCVPTNILVTSRKVQLILFLQNPVHTASHVNGLCLAISQPHILLYFKNRQSMKLEVSLFDISASVTPKSWSKNHLFFDNNDQRHTWTNDESFILAEMKNVIKTRSGHPDLKTGVPKSFLTVTLSDFFVANGSKVNLNFARQIMIGFDIEDIEQVVGMLHTLEQHPENREVKIASGSSIPCAIFTPQQFTLTAEFVSFRLSENRKCDSSFEFKLGKISIKADTLKNILLNNLQSSIECRCDSVVFVSGAKDDRPIVRAVDTLILKPFKVAGKFHFKKYRPDSVDRHWVSSELYGEMDVGSLNITLSRQQLLKMYSLVQAVKVPEMVTSSTTKIVNGGQSDTRVEMFYDDLRSEKFRIYTKVNNETSIHSLNNSAFNVGPNVVANDATVAFSDDGEDVAAMYWTYPEARFVTCIDVKPVPFVFIEYKLTKDDNYEQLQIPCQLEYWSCSNNCYKLYKNFHLSENRIERIDSFPTQSDMEVVAAKSWRVVFDCYARYMKTDEENRVSYSERAMLVYLSPLVLAASMQVNSCYAPSIVRNSCIKFSSPLIRIIFRDTEQTQRNSEDLCKPFHLANECFSGCSIIDNTILFTVTFSNFESRYLLKGDLQVKVSNGVVHIARPFVAIKTAILLAENVDMTFERNNNSKFNIEVIQAAIDQSILRQLVGISENLKELINLYFNSKLIESYQNKHQLMFCNFLDRRVRLRQHQDNFYKVDDGSKVGGISSGEAVLLKFLPTNYHKYKTAETESVPHDLVKLTLGLCSELKGTVRWTEAIEIPYLSYGHVTTSTSNLRIWNIDCATSLDTPICSNSSNLSNSYNARNLVLLHHQSINGLNRLILTGNTVFNNITPESVNVSLALPSELSSGFSFHILPSNSAVITTSIHINWRLVSLATPKNVFELSFRIGNDNADNVEYRSLPYRMTVPSFDNVSVKSQYHHSIIKLRKNKFENQEITLRDSCKHIFCTLEWFHLNKNEDLFLLMTLSPLVVCKNMMLHDVKMHLTWTLNSDGDDDESLVKESVAIMGKGGLFKLIDVLDNKSVELNASFPDDPKLLFEKPLFLSEGSLMDSVNQNLYKLHSSHSYDQDHEQIRQIVSNRIIDIIDKIQLEPSCQLFDNPYSVVISIMPWILITNSTKMNLVLGFDRSIFLLEALNDFVPPQYEKPVKIGITHDSEIYWSKTFSIGNSVLSETDSDLTSDHPWTVLQTEVGSEAYLQITIVVDKTTLVPITLRHTFAQNAASKNSYISLTTARYDRITLESSVHVCNRTKIDLNAMPVSISKKMFDDFDTAVNDLSLPSTSDYIPVERFTCVGHSVENLLDAIWFLGLTKSEDTASTMSFSNMASIIDFKKLSNFRDLENIIYTGFLYIEESREECQEVDFVAFIVNSTLDYRSHRIFADIFESKSVPVKITNHSFNAIFMNEYENGTNNIKPIIYSIRPIQSVPFWPSDFQINFNKDGSGQFSNLRLRLGVQVDNVTHWTDYFPLSVPQEPTNLDLVTKTIRQHLYVHIESLSAATIDIHIYEHEAAARHVPLSPAVPSYGVNISVTKCILSVLESCHDLERHEETLRLSLANVSLLHVVTAVARKTLREVSVGDIQLDNKRYESGSYDFPVILYSRNTGSLTKFFRCRVETDDCDNYNIDVKFEQEMELFVENVLLYDLLRVFAVFSQCIISGPQQATTRLYSSPPLNLTAVNISSIPIIITVHAFLKIYVSCEATSLSLPKFCLPLSLARMRYIQKKLYEHYFTAALVRCGWVMGSFELLGNPSGIVNHLSTGISRLLCSKNIDHGLLADFLIRVFSFCRFTTGGLVSSFTGIASSLSRNLDYLCLDSTHITRQDSFRRQYQPNGLVHGLFQGLSGFALSMLGAIAGLADHPLQASHEALDNNSSVTIAIIKGLGKGLIGVLTKPLSGTAELFAQTGRGLLRTTGICTLKSHCLHERCELVTKSELAINDSEVVMHFTNGQEAETVLWCGLASNCQQKPVYLFLCSSALIEWHLDSPLRGRHDSYALCDYDLRPHGWSSRSSIELCAVERVSKHQGRVDTAFSSLANTDNRLSVFLSQQVCEASATPTVTAASPRRYSHSSNDSIEFVNVAGPMSASIESVAEDNVDCVVTDETIVFLLDDPRDGILDAANLLHLYRDNFCGRIL